MKKGSEMSLLELLAFIFCVLVLTPPGWVVVLLLYLAFKS